MAVKPITNPNPTPKEKVNRAEEVSLRNVTVDGGNREMSVTPGNDFTKDYEIVLKDLDKSLMNHVKNVMKIKVQENGEMIDVPVMYGNQERWANVRKPDGVIRDRNGSLVLPLIMLKRSRVDFNESFPMWHHDLTGENIEVIRSSKYSSKNQYSNFSIQQGIKPVQERIITGPPQYVNLTYDFVVWTHYMDQMNLVSQQFLNQTNRYWGDNVSYRFLCKVDGGISDATEMSAGDERIVRHTFSIILNGYLIHEYVANIINKKRHNLKKALTKGKIVFSENVE